MQRLCGRVASVIDGLLTEWTVVERLIDSCDPAECLMAIRLLEQWGLVTRFSRDGGIFLNWRDESTATIAPKLLALLDGRVDRIAQLGAEHGCPAHAIAVLPSRDEHASGNAHRHALRSLASGKGTSLGAAILGGLAEAAERICAAHRGDEAAERTMLARAGERVIPPGDLLLYSDAQYQSRKAWNLHHRGKNRVPPPIDPAACIDWVEVQAIHDGATWRVPAAYCYLHYRWRAGEPQFCEADTNGCAVGSTRDEAIVRALLELLERDAAATWWYNRLRRPAVNLGELEHDAIPAMRAWLAMRGRSLHVLDLSGDLPIFVAAAVSAGPRGDRIAFGFGAHFDRDRAALAAVSEMHQFAAQATLLERLASEGRAPTLSSDVVVFMEWWRSQFLADHPHLVPTQTRAPAGSSHYDIADSEADLERIVRELKHRNLTPLVLDLTRADIGVPAVRAIVPGLRPWWARFAPGRLYQIPVALGWLAHPLVEDELNPVPMFI